jgi:hypothetical protein
MRVWLLPVFLVVASCGGNSGGGSGGLSGLNGQTDGSTGVAGAGGAAGSAGSTVPRPIGGACAGPAGCQTMMCLGLAANRQKQAGICSKACQDDSACGGAGYICVDLAGDNKGYCMHTCQAGGACSDGFACLSLDDPTDPISICFVEADSGAGGASGMGGASGTGGSTGGSADCQSKGCEIYTDPAMVDGYCAMTPNAKKLCDCPTLDVPPTCKPTNPAAANLYCCP